MIWILAADFRRTAIFFLRIAQNGYFIPYHSIYGVYLGYYALCLKHFSRIYLLILFVSSKRNNYEKVIKRIAISTFTSTNICDDVIYINTYN